MRKFLASIMVMVLSILFIETSLMAKKGEGGHKQMPVEFFGQASSTTTGAADLVFTVTGLKTTMECVVTPKSYGTGPVSFTKAVVTANTITLTVNANQTAGTTVINYICFKR